MGGPAASLQLPLLLESLHGQRKDSHAENDFHTAHRMDAPGDAEVTLAPEERTFLQPPYDFRGAQTDICRESPSARRERFEDASE